jgi:flagellar export protein FliJ
MAHYRLQTLLELRASAREAAERALAQAVRDLAVARRRLEDLERDLRQRREARRRKLATFLSEMMERGGGATEFDQMHRFEERLKDEEAQLGLEIDRQNDLVNSAARAVEEKRHEMEETAKELKAIEKHKESWSQQLRLEMEAREERSQEEVGNTLHHLRTRK